MSTLYQPESIAGTRSTELLCDDTEEGWSDLGARDHILRQTAHPQIDVVC